LNGLHKDFSIEKLQSVWLEMLLCRNVQEFDYYLSQMLRKALRKHPEILMASDSTAPMSDEVLLEAAERKVHELSFKSLKNIVRYLNDALSLGFDDQMPEYFDACEMFQVSNIFVHNGGIIDQMFIRITGDTTFKVGEPFPLTEKYVFSREYKLNTVAEALDQRFKSHFGLE
jgi:hypothetical protein